MAHVAALPDQGRDSGRMVGFELLTEPSVSRVLPSEGWALTVAFLFRVRQRARRNVKSAGDRAWTSVRDDFAAASSAPAGDFGDPHAHVV